MMKELLSTYSKLVFQQGICKIWLDIALFEYDLIKNKKEIVKKCTWFYTHIDKVCNKKWLWQLSMLGDQRYHRLQRNGPEPKDTLCCLCWLYHGQNKADNKELQQ